MPHCTRCLFPLSFCAVWSVTWMYLLHYGTPALLRAAIFPKANCTSEGAPRGPGGHGYSSSPLSRKAVSLMACAVEVNREAEQPIQNEGNVVTAEATRTQPCMPSRQPFRKSECLCPNVSSQGSQTHSWACSTAATRGYCNLRQFAPALTLGTSSVAECPHPFPFQMASP